MMFNDLEIEAARLQAVFDAELEHMRLEAEAGNITPETAQAVADAAKAVHAAEDKAAEPKAAEPVGTSAGTPKPDGTPKPKGVSNKHGVPDSIIEAAKREALKITVDALADEGLDRQDNAPIAITFTRKQSQAIRACQELVSSNNDAANGRSHQEFVSDCVMSVFKSAIAVLAQELLGEAEIHIIDMDDTDDTHEKSDGE